MRILSIRGKNLASLEGEFQVDFTREPLCSAGIYAITGPTGSGKSTILDALCLALFARSPRQTAAKESGIELRDGESGTIGQGDPRTILRKGAAEGFAAASFTGLDGNLYESVWSVRRARNKPSGNLQDYSLQLTNLTSGIPYPEKKMETLKEIERLIGLNYDQFTRSVLLAQGDFTAFLKAGRDDKAALLEKITGTDIYSRISQSIYAGTKEAEQAWKEIQIRLEGITLLSEEEISELQGKESGLREEIIRMNQLKEQLRSGLEWFGQKEKLELEIAGARQELEMREKTREEASGRTTRFFLVEKVQPARQLIVSRKEKADQLAGKEKAILDTEEKYAAVEATLNEIIPRLKEAEQQLERIIQSAEDARPLIKKATEKDTLISTQKQLLQTLQTEAGDAQGRFAILKNGFTEKERLLNKTREEIGELEKWIREKGAGQSIAENIVYVGANLLSAENLKKEEVSLAGKISGEKEKLDQLGIEITHREEEREEREKLIIGQREAIRKSGEAMAAIPVAHLEKEEREHTGSQERLQAMKGCWDKLFEQSGRANQLKREMEETGKQLEEAQGKLGKCIASLEEVTIRADQTEHLLNQARLAVAGDVEMLRSRLTGNEPCPVCGSTQHPWASDATRLHTVFDELNNHFAALSRERNDLTGKKAGIEESLRNLSSFRQKTEAEATHLDTLVESLTTDWESFDPGEAVTHIAAEQRAAFLLREAEDHRQKALAAKEKMAEYNTLRNEADLLKGELEKGREAQEAVVKAVNSLTEEQRLLLRDIGHHEDLLQTMHRQIRETVAGLSLYLTQPGWEEKWVANPENFRQKLVQFAGEWKSKTGSLEEKKRNHQGQIAETTAAKSRMEEAGEMASQVTLKVRQEMEKLALLLQERNTIFEGKPVSRVEEELVKAQEDGNAKVKGLQKTKEEILGEMTGLKGSVLQLKTDRLALTGEAEFYALKSRLWLEEFNTNGSTSLTDAELENLMQFTADWITAERKFVQQLDDDILKARSTLTEREGQFEKHLGNRKGTEEKEVLKIKTRETEELIKDRTGSYNEARFKLRNDEDNKKAAGALLTELEAKRRVMERWQKLNGLLGSADGKKFRQIAQEYTLEVLLGYANLHLEELTGRYTLEVVPDTLALQVVDRDMGDEIRSVHSLSGGESFLVSLALALGLASLSSNRMSIESLFIDEGFGSLDPQTLGIAMDALERLHGQGRKVGVISHVQEMTERIRAQVRVIRKSNGRSKVEVMG